MAIEFIKLFYRVQNEVLYNNNNNNKCSTIIVKTIVSCITIIIEKISPFIKLFVYFDKTHGIIKKT